MKNDKQNNDSTETNDNVNEENNTVVSAIDKLYEKVLPWPFNVFRKLYLKLNPHKRKNPLICE